MKLTFTFDYASPFAYLGASQVAAVAKAHDAEIHYRPILLGAVFQTIGTPMVPLMTMPKVKQKHVLLDLHRHADLFDIPFRFPSRFPMNTVTALRMTLQVSEPAALMLRIFEAYWGHDRDISDKAELKAIADGADLDGAALLAGAAEQSVKDGLRANTTEAIEAGIYGVPTFGIEDGDKAPIRFFGQDRLPLVHAALDGWRPRGG